MNKPETTLAFDDAARLYAQYEPVVREMERAFHSSIDKFLLNVRAAIDEQSAPLSVDDEDKKSWRIWWLSKRKGAPEEVPYLWFYHRKVELVVPGQLEFTVNVTPEARSLRPGVEKALSSLKLPPMCSQKKRPAEGGIATYLISYGKSPQPAQEVAEVFLLVLRAIEPFKK